MPVSTRSQISTTGEDEQNEPNLLYEQRTNQEETTRSHVRNPHHGLKEKMKALTLLYEQQKRARNNQSQLRAEEKPPFPEGNKLAKDLKAAAADHNVVMRENTIITSAANANAIMPNSKVTRTHVLPQPQPQMEDDDAKENNFGNHRIIGFSCPRKKSTTVAAARRLSMGATTNSVPPQLQTEPPKGIGCGNEEKMMISEKMGSRNIHVFVRLRPMGKKEKEAGCRCCVRIVNRRDVYLTEFATENDYLRLKRLRGRHFTFDASFPDSATQHQVYSTTTVELVEAVLQGRNGSVFCYGATGAGKTYTMLGTVENPGVMVLAIKDLFTKIRQRSSDGNHVVHLSYLEVYNETVRDLLSPGRPLVLREDKQGIVAAGLTQYRAYSTDEVMALLLQGNQNRTTEPTRANETSSRSHAILQVMVEYHVKDAAMNVVNKVGKLSLIDLAGSERALATDQRTLRSLEGANINRSLLALSSCINALVEGKKHIPYRNSKLTQLLKDSLGGSCNTIMIANISPSNLSFGETQNTLHWADRAKEIRNKIQASEANEEILPVPESDAKQAKLILELQKENRELRVQLARQQQKLLTLQAQSLAVAAHSSPTPSSVTSSLLTPPSSARPTEKQYLRPSFLASNCYTPETKKKGADHEVVIRELQRTVKTLEAEIAGMKKDHALQLKQRDDYIRELSRKGEKPSRTAGDGAKRVVTRSSLKPKEPSTGEMKSPSHRFLSPAPTAKKRSFWDITTANSPSAARLSGRKTRSYVIPEPAAAPSMLLQPGFARHKPEALR